jgi:oligosaccharide translocation protein RFT1
MSSSSGSLFNNAKLFLLGGILQKIITFTLNQILVAHTTPEVLGRASVQLELLLSSLLFLSREGIRLAVLRQNAAEGSNLKAIVNISWIPSLAIFLFILLLALGSRHYMQEQDLTVVYLYAFAAFIECLAEPCYNYFQSEANIKPKMAAETIAVFIKCLATVLCMVQLRLGVVAFGIAQIVYSIVYVLVLLYHIIVIQEKLNERTIRIGDFIPEPIGKLETEAKKEVSSSYISRYLDFGLMNVALTLTGSSILKHVLTESDKIALTLSASNYDQGIYAVTNNYGSLIARMVFLPLEDSSRLAFSKMATEFKLKCKLLVEQNGHSSGSIPPVLDLTATEKRDECQKSLLELSGLFVRLLRLVGFIGIFIATFGIPYVSVVVRLVLSAKWRTVETVNALSMYCLYILVLGLNGVSESFVQSCAPSSAFKVLNFGLLLSSAGFVLTAIFSVRRIGTSGIVLANTVGMLLRVVNNCWHISNMLVDTQGFFNVTHASGSIGTGASDIPAKSAVKDSSTTRGNTLSKASGSDATLPGALSGDLAHDVNALCLEAAGSPACRNQLAQLPSLSRPELVARFTPPMVWVVSLVASCVVVHVSAYWYAQVGAGATASSGVPAPPTVKQMIVHVLVGGATAVVFLLVTLYSAPAEDADLIWNKIPFVKRSTSISKKTE